jgi:transposase
VAHTIADYSNAIRDELQDATAVLDAFHVVRLGLKAMEETRRRVQQEQLGHRSRKNDRCIGSATRCARAPRS